MVSMFCFELMLKRETSKENSCCSALVCLPPIYNENYSGILISQTSRYLEPNLVSLGFTSLELYNFTPDFSNPRFLEPIFFPVGQIDPRELEPAKISKQLSPDVNYIHAYKQINTSG